MDFLNLYTLTGLAVVLLGLGGLFLGALLRVVVPTEAVHIVQSARRTTSYGKETGNGNVYYAFPAYLPLLGVVVTIMPVSVFDLELKAYEAYDKDRLPFKVDVVAFFRVSDSNVAAERVKDFEELRNQLHSIVQGAVRTILANSVIDEIMRERSIFGDRFTQEVSKQLIHWGISAVKNIELMDIRDSDGSSVIHSIMEKKKSHIEMESRTEVAKNKKDAEMAEILAKQEIETTRQGSFQAIGLRTAESDQAVSVARQTATQRVREQEKITKEKEMDIHKVALVRQADIEKEVAVVKSNQAREVSIIEANTQQETTVRIAQGQLESTKLAAEGVQAQGVANAESLKALELAPIQAQIVLAKEIGENSGYQGYLITIKKIEADKEVGMEKAKALQKADIKVIANSGDATSGITSAAELLTSKGGQQLGAMLEGLSQTPVGDTILKKITGTTTTKTNKSA